MAQPSDNRILRFWKPYGCLTAFTDHQGRETLADHIDVADVYPAGRLDRDSEGLLVLAGDPRLRGDLTDNTIGHPRRYLVQVEGVPTADALHQLSRGVALNDGETLPAQVDLLSEPPDLPARPVPIRVRKSVPDSWLRLTLTEGRNRQVRRMTAAVGFPTLRLVRVEIGPITLDGLEPGRWQFLDDRQRSDLVQSLKQARRTSRSASGPRRQGRYSRR